MGLSQSRPAAPLLGARLAAAGCGGKDGEDGVVQVGCEKAARDPFEPLVSPSTAAAWEKELLQDPKNRLALSALTKASSHDILLSQAASITTPHLFNVVIPIAGAPITNQRSSGRCWLFAATNVFRVALMRAYKIEEFELSQAYLFYWDKLEKANWFLAQIVETADEELGSRVVQELIGRAVSDGGQWDMVANLVKKYGLVPQALYPDSFNAKNSRAMNSIVKTKLREHALHLRKLAKSNVGTAGLTAAKDEMLREIHLILTLMLGPPPSPTREFSWEYYDQTKTARTLTRTPLGLAAELSAAGAGSGSDVARLFSLVHDPRHPAGTLLTVARLGNVVGGRGITYANVDMAVLKAACVAQLRAGIPVFFGCDVGKFSDNPSGVMDCDLLDFELGFNVRLGMSKAQRLETGESAMTHAMVLSGVHVLEGKSVRWRVQNSWGKDRGKDGWFVMSDRWMDEWVYQAVVDPKFVSKEVHGILDKDPIVLPLWDPMGSLALL